MDKQYLQRNKPQQAAANFLKRKRQVADDYRMDESTRTKKLTAVDLQRMVEDAQMHLNQTVYNAQCDYFDTLKELHAIAEKNGLLRDGLAPWEKNYPRD